MADFSFFNSKRYEYKSEFRNYYMLQNIVAVRNSSIIFFSLNLILRLMFWIFPESLSKAQNFPEFNASNWIYIIVTPFFFLVSYWFAGSYKVRKEATSVMSFFVMLFAIYIIACGMFSSFIATSDPRNALTLYLIALSIISVIFVFEYMETSILILVAEVMFTALLLYSNADGTEMIYDQLISIILLCGFYIVSRYFFAYKASYYQQVIEITDKNIEIEKAGAFKSEILGMVAHDLRNPIGAIEMLVMLMETDEIDEETKENFDMIKTSCVSARNIIGDLLEAARNENVNNFETKETELNSFIKRVVNMWEIQQDTDNIVLVSTVKKVYAKINKEKFTRVMDNLLSNAFKFSKKTDQIEVHLSLKDDGIVIAVKDSGVGVPKDMIPHLFDRFTKAGRQGLNGEQSTGIGLSIVKQIVESHKGKIAVSSEENKGTTFTIWLPQVIV